MCEEIWCAVVWKRFDVHNVGCESVILLATEFFFCVANIVTFSLQCLLELRNWCRGDDGFWGSQFGMGTAEWRASKKPAYYDRISYIPGVKVKTTTTTTTQLTSFFPFWGHHKLLLCFVRFFDWCCNKRFTGKTHKIAYWKYIFLGYDHCCFPGRWYGRVCHQGSISILQRILPWRKGTFQCSIKLLQFHVSAWPMVAVRDYPMILSWCMWKKWCQCMSKCPLKSTFLLYYMHCSELHLQLPCILASFRLDSASSPQSPDVQSVSH